MSSAVSTKSREDQLTPLMRQYYLLKSQHPEHVLFFRCGDFYEMFDEDAKTASQVLGIALTKRGTNGRGDPCPLAGVPYHSVEPYLARLIRAGYKVAICEQMENPKNAKGVVRREIVRVVTPGTVLEDNLLENKTNNYLVGLVKHGAKLGLAALDFSTGEFAITETDAAAACASELARLQPPEIVVLAEQREELTELLNAAREARTTAGEQEVSVSSVNLPGFSISLARDRLIEQLRVRDLSGFGADKMDAGVVAAGAILEYLRETQRQQLVHVNTLRVYHPGEYMTLDATTQRSLELVANLNDATRRNTLLEVLDHTATAMGGRTLRAWVLQPLRNRELIEQRLDAVQRFATNHDLRSRATDQLRQVHDLERIVSRCACKTANARDLLALCNSLVQLPALQALLRDHLPETVSQLHILDALAARLDAAIAENPPLSVREGGIIKAGYNAQLDELRSVATDSKSWIASMRQQEIERTGITNLKIGYNRVFGYYIEISNSHLAKVPQEYIRKQTLVGAERFITPELKQKEEIILHAEERSQELEFELFEALREEVCASAREIQATAAAVGRIDALLSLAHAAVAGNYCRPQIADGTAITFRDGRHPVLESLRLDQPFVPNDAHIDNGENQILVITGPNMAGKSTYIRQVALITLMAHMGSYVPAREASICPVDRIFTRVGAMDQLARGQSTFLVEMTETANILNNSTDSSLVILDEIGRGTSTYDGLSIAWAVVEFLHNTKGRRPKTLFATHYHELAELEGPLERVKNYNVAVLEEEDRVAFLYKIVRGSTDHSYGIYAAQVAGLPRTVVERAKRILFDLEMNNSISVAPGQHPTGQQEERVVQLTLFDSFEHPVMEQLRGVDINKLTPVEALTFLARLAEQARR